VPLVKPPTPVWQPGHPLARSCVFYVPFTEKGGSPRDIVGGAVGSLGSGATWAAGPDGPEIDTDGGAVAGVNFGQLASIYTGLAPPFSFAVRLRVDAGHSYITLGKFGGNTQNFAILVDLNNVITVAAQDGIPTTNYLVGSTSAGALTNGVYHNILGVWTSPNTVAVYVDSGAKAITYSAQNTIGPLGASADDFFLGGEPGITRTVDGRLTFAAMWKADMRSQAAAIVADPWAPARPRTRLIVPFGGAGGGAAASDGTLAVTLGATTLSATGTAATAPASAGALAVTLGATTVAASGTASAAASAAGTLAVTLGAITVSATGTAGTAAASAGTLTVTLGSVTLAATGIAGTVDGAVGSLSVTLGAVTLAGAGVASTPGTSSGTLAVALGATTLTASATSPGGLTTVDMVDSVATVLDGITDLNTAFGSTGWFWHTLAPPRTPVPYVVWRESSGSILGESGGASWLTDSTYSVSVYAATRAEARRLCRAAVDAIEAAADAGSIVFTEGALASLRREAGAFDQLDPDPGEDGADVWEHRIVLRAFVDDQVTVS
jgi:hypothetical protein